MVSYENKMETGERTLTPSRAGVVGEVENVFLGNGRSTEELAMRMSINDVKANLRRNFPGRYEPWSIPNLGTAKPYPLP